MGTYLVQVTVDAAEAGDVSSTVAAVRAVVIAMTTAGQPLRLLHTVYVAADRTCLHVIDAEDAATVIEALRRAGTSSARVLPAVVL